MTGLLRVGLIKIRITNMHKIVFSPFPNLTTERFNLRQLRLKDKNEIFLLRSDERVNQFLDRPIAKTVNDARQFINKIKTGIAKNEAIYWAITLLNQSKLIGTICLWNLSDDGTKAEIGFELLPNYLGRGIMHEVLPIIIQYGFETMKLKSIEGEVDPNNVNSIKLMEKNGFNLKEKLSNTLIYSLQN